MVILPLLYVSVTVYLTVNPRIFPLFQQYPVFVFRYYLSLMSMVNHRALTSHCGGQRGLFQKLLTIPVQPGVDKWPQVSKSDSLNPGLWIVSEVTQRWKDSPRAMTPDSCSALAPAFVPDLCSRPILQPSHKFWRLPNLLPVNSLFAFAGQITVVKQFLLLATQQF